VGPYSNSKLSTYENCPRQFEFRYVQRIPAETESIEAFVGKRVHEILERLYHHVNRWRRPPSLRQVLDRFEKDWPLRWSDRVEIIRPDSTIEDYQRLGARCLENYYRSHYPFDAGETVAIEEPVSLRLDPEGRYQVRGIVDRIARAAPGRYEIHDYKTGGWLPPQKRLDADRQLALYQIGLEQTYPDVESVELVWHYLLFNRTLRSERSPDALAELRETTIRLIDTIEAAGEFPAKPGPLCRWCEYRGICPDARQPRTDDEPPFPGDEVAPPGLWAGGDAAPDGTVQAAPDLPTLTARPTAPAPTPAAPQPRRAEQLALF
jgi:putative RecB family exonuclease